MPLDAELAYKRPGRRWERLTVAVWLATLAIIVACAILKPESHTVYPIYTRAARDWLTGRDLYRHVDDPYRYSPLIATLFTPISSLPDRLGGPVWRLLNAAV